MNPTKSKNIRFEQPLHHSLAFPVQMQKKAAGAKEGCLKAKVSCSTRRLRGRASFELRFE